MHQGAELQEGDKYGQFEVTRAVEIHELRCRLLELKHLGTGAQVLHLANEDPENLFCLSFRTYPSSSNGVAHILEHTVLCGSEKYPVKDPFFLMMRRSLNTFMNALTGSDFTCYPAASQVKGDFYNLLEVYLDAVFKPNLRELSFRQEGHRLEFEKPEDPESALEYKGIVFNEMKGAMSSMDARMSEQLDAALLPDITYGVNSGGSPKVIPDLSYEELLGFHQNYYHPSRCLFFFYGDLPLEEHLDFIEEHALSQAPPMPDLPPLPRQKRFAHPVRKTASYPIAADQDPKDKTMIAFSWLTCHISEQEDLLALTLLDSILMDTDASPLKKALLRSGLCRQAYSYLYDSHSEIQFTVNLKGCNPENSEALEKLLFETLQTIAKEGISEELTENALHQLEFHRSEITSDGYPFGLILFMRAGLLKQHQGNPEDALTLHGMVERIRKKIKKDPRYLVKKLEELILDHSHWARVTLLPDFELTRKEEEEERARLAAIKEGLTEKEKREIVEQAERLERFQKEQEEIDYEVLPKVSLSDVPKETRDYRLQLSESGSLKVYHHDCFTNGIVYADLYYSLPELSEEQLPYASLFSKMVSQVGCGGRNYSENLAYIQAHTGGVGAALALHPQAEDSGKFSPSFSLHGKALHRKSDKLFSLLREMVGTLDFTDIPRLKELVEKQATALQSRLVSSAMKYAMNESSSGFDLASKINNYWGGLHYYRTLRDLASNFDEQADHLVATLESLKSSLLGLKEPHLVLSCDQEMADKLRQENYYGLHQLPQQSYPAWKGGYPLIPIASHGRAIGTPVAFSSMAFKTFPYAHPETPALKVAAQLFDNTTLHARIREQGGAYGGGAKNSSSEGNFYFYAYRDPNISSTIQAFHDSVAAILKGDFTDRDLEEAKLEIIQELDSPVSPGSRADVAYAWRREGKSRAVRQAYRDQLISLTREEVIAAVREHIEPKLKEAVFVTFAGEELIQSENSALPIEKI